MICVYFGKTLVVAAGNNADKGGHKRIRLQNNITEEVEFIVGGRRAYIKHKYMARFLLMILVYIW